MTENGMKRLKAGLVLLLGLLVAPLDAEAQQAGRMYRIGYLSTPTRESVEHGLEAFLRTLRGLGWIEGQNLIIEYRWAEGDVERLPELRRGDSMTRASGAAIVREPLE
jgi:putative tryptophan/tyrosine transport system substrate-binding protein